jgi:branched-chain amino acid transport system substrate-binding protein
VNQVNAAGGVNGKKIEVITLDDQGKAEESAMAATKLITQDHVQAIIGAVTSSRSMAMGPIAVKYKTPMITATATNAKVTELGDNVFRVCYIDAFQGRIMAKFALEHLKIKTAAVLRDIKNDYSMGLSDVFISHFKAGGGEIVSEQSFSSGDIDFKSQLTSIRAKNPEAIFIPAYYSDVGLIARQVRELGIKTPLLGTDGWDSPKLIEIAGSAMNNAYFSNHYSSEGTSVVVKKFITQFKEKYQVIPEGIAALGYDAAGVLIDSLKRSKSLTQSDIRQSLSELKDYTGVTGKMKMDKNRNPIKSAVILKVENGHVKYDSLIDPE